eukprot:4803724-Pleurochrysis_carterae.AAC.1
MATLPECRSLIAARKLSHHRPCLGHEQARAAHARGHSKRHGTEHTQNGVQPRQTCRAAFGS